MSCGLQHVSVNCLRCLAFSAISPFPCSERREAAETLRHMRSQALLRPAMQSSRRGAVAAAAQAEAAALGGGGGGGGDVEGGGTPALVGDSPLEGAMEDFLVQV